MIRPIIIENLTAFYVKSRTKPLVQTQMDKRRLAREDPETIVFNQFTPNIANVAMLNFGPIIKGDTAIVPIQAKQAQEYSMATSLTDQERFSILLQIEMKPCYYKKKQPVDSKTLESTSKKSRSTTQQGVEELQASIEGREEDEGEGPGGGRRGQGAQGCQRQYHLLGRGGS